MSAESERILILAPSRRDGEIAGDELQREGIASHVCASISELCHEMTVGAGGALLTEDALTESARAQLVSTLARQPPWSDFPLLVLGSRSRPRESSSRDLEALGNITLLDAPLRVRTMCRAALAALRGRRRQYAAARAIAERDRFLAMLGHELRNPLSAISLAIEVAQVEASLPPREIRVIQHQVSHLVRLVDDLLDVARVTAGKITLQQAKLDVGALVQSIAQSIATRFEAADLRLSIECEIGTTLVLGDEVRLEQVMVNLLTNALKYTPGGGEVRVTAGLEHGEAAITVEDDGVGIAPDILPRIFDVFAQADDTLARSQGGMGIGLTLVHAIIALHGGTVTATSEGVGCGSRFEIRLPCATAEDSPSRPGAEAPARQARAGLSIVLIDDHEDSLQLLSISLQHLGHVVATAADGMTGLQLIAQVQPDAAIIDIGLPDIDGFEVARRIRQDLDSQIHLIALTGYGQPRDRRRAVAAGFDEHLTKPAALSTLLSALGLAS